MAERLGAPEIDDDEAQARLVRLGAGSVETWQRAQRVLLSAQRMLMAKIADVTFTSADLCGM